MKIIPPTCINVSAAVIWGWGRDFNDLVTLGK